MKRKKLKLNRERTTIFIIFILSMFVIIHDIYMLTINFWVTGDSYGWTWCAFISFMLAVMVAGVLGEYIYDDFNK